MLSSSKAVKHSSLPMDLEILSAFLYSVNSLLKVSVYNNGRFIIITTFNYARTEIARAGGSREGLAR